MAFSSFGRIGSGGAAGFLGGMETASQRIEKAKQEKESTAMAMYSKLLSSGEWEPVGKGGSPDGGVLKIGDVGLLKRRKVSSDPVSLAKIAYYEAQTAKARRPREQKFVEKEVVYDDGTSAMISIPKGQDVLLETGRFGSKYKPPTPTYKYWTKDGKLSAIERGKLPPEGSKPVSSSGGVTEKLVLLHEDNVVRDRLRTKEKELKEISWAENLDPEKIKPGTIAEKNKQQAGVLRQEIADLNSQRDEISKLLGDSAGIKQRALEEGSPIKSQEGAKELPAFGDIVKEPGKASEIIAEVKKKVAAILRGKPQPEPPGKDDKRYKIPTAQERYLAPKKKQKVKKKTPPRPYMGITSKDLNPKKKVVKRQMPVRKRMPTDFKNPVGLDRLFPKVVN